MYEMLVGQSPFHGEGEDELFDSILNERPYFPKSISKEAAKCLSAVRMMKDEQVIVNTSYFSCSIAIRTHDSECPNVQMDPLGITLFSVESIGINLKVGSQRHLSSLTL